VLVLIAYWVIRKIRAKRRKAALEAALLQKRPNNRFLLRNEESDFENEQDADDDSPLLSAINNDEYLAKAATVPPSLFRSAEVIRPAIDIEFKDIELKVSGGKKTVLQNVSGRFRPGELSAVMGPSGMLILS
jgi:ABC-type multidrug transport system fused ATPase/permease subunit